MDKETLESNIKKNYKIVQNYLNGDPGAEGFLNSLADLQTDFANYLVEILKTKKYGKDDVKKSNIYQGHIRGGNEKHINNENLEQIISNKILGKKVSINSLLDEGIKKLEKLFDTQKSFEDALKTGKLQSVQLNKVILPSDDLPVPTIGHDKSFNKKELGQNKLRLFVSTLRDLGIYDDDLIIYSGEVDNNMMRKNTYYAIFIPRINKTVFINTGYSEATFICEGEISIKDMTTIGKEKLQDELGATKIKFFENNVEGRKSELTNVLLGNGGKVGKKIEVKKIKNKINRLIKLDKLKTFYTEHKNDTFIDSDGNIATIEKLFSSIIYYEKNYRIINDNPSFKTKLLSNLNRVYNITWTNLQKELGIENGIATLEELKTFYIEHKNDNFIDSNKNLSTVQKLFSSFYYYKKNYKIFNKNTKSRIKLPCDPAYYYNITWIEFQQQLDINKIASLDDLKTFYSEHKNDTFIDSDGNTSTIKNLFSNFDYYQKNHKIILSKIKLPSTPYQFYNITREELQKELGIKKNYLKLATLEQLKIFYSEHKNDSFIDSDGKPSTFKKLFSSSNYYKQNYKIINNDLPLNIKLPCYPNRIYNITWAEFQQELGFGVEDLEIISLENLKSFYNKHKNDNFTDSNGNTTTIKILFSSLVYYKKNYKMINNNPSFKVKLPGNPQYSYNITWEEIKKFLGIN